MCYSPRGGAIKAHDILTLYDCFRIDILLYGPTCPCIAPFQLQVALNECREKHRGANAALYGGLRYILLTVTAGDMFGVYALRLEGGYDVEVLVTPFSVSCCSAFDTEIKMCIAFVCSFVYEPDVPDVHAGP